ncbi:uncharacterized protein N7469_004622 [Penicillium citrinum]|uniref:Uncharacterized protein n=1 Tax=Penicillium citrinum TaxID=5077 RepID=A0A9W9P4W7_PENCI|nr:uncharacterized protein N7469_004622 [Penicillium citrinum]KAJ5235454.1 hypothetical protein N7469_004622 [Penicillium citrinum]
MEQRERQRSEELEGETYEERQKWLLPYYEKWNIQKRYDGVRVTWYLSKLLAHGTETRNRQED